MARKNRRAHNQNASVPLIDPLLMNTAGVTNTPLGLVPVLPVPSFDGEDRNIKPDGDANRDILP